MRAEIPGDGEEEGGAGDRGGGEGGRRGTTLNHFIVSLIGLRIGKLGRQCP